MSNFKDALFTGHGIEAFGFEYVPNSLGTYVKEDVCISYFGGELQTVYIGKDSLFDLFRLDAGYPLTEYLENIPEVLEHLRKVVGA